MELTPEVTIGIIAVFGVALIAILMMLKRMNIIKFASNGISASVNTKCNDHASFCQSFKVVRDEGLKHCQILEQHEKRLDEGTQAFVKIKSDVAEIKENIAVLLDRSMNRRATDTKTNG